MKKALLIASLLFSSFLFCQTGNSAHDQERYQEEMEKARKESLENLMERLKEDLKLNELQVIAIEQIYTESSKKQGIILKKEISDDDKVSALKSLGESTEKKVLDLLDAQQKEKFEVLKAEANNPKKNKKKDKKKKDKK
ncbi:MAG: hypothetical protein JNJ52_05415 [Flavobacterium sp.]|nr:hypothetical protein [Flavobacterium sp.]